MSSFLTSAGLFNSFTPVMAVEGAGLGLEEAELRAWERRAGDVMKRPILDSMDLLAAQ